MSYKLLKFVISHLKKKSRCPFCRAAIDDDAIFVLATSAANEVQSQGLFFIICPSCAAHAFVMVEVNKEQIRVTTKPTTAEISTNDILDMHNFLKQWQGDVKELFSEL